MAIQLFVPTFRIDECLDEIKECLEMAKKGAKVISIDTGDLTNDEIKYLEKEVKRRLRNGF